MPDLLLDHPKPNIPDLTPKTSSEAIPEEEKEFPVNFDPFPGMNESKVLDWAKKCNNAWEQWFNQGMNPEQKRIEQYNKMYMCQNMDTRQPHLPVPNATVETLHANIMRTLMQRPKVVEAKPKFITNDNEQQQLIEDLVNQEILFQEDARKKLSGIIKTASISEFSIVKSYWESYSCPDIKPVYSSIGGIPKLVSAGKITKTRGRSVYEQVPELNFAFDPDCISALPKASWVRHRDYKPVSELLQMQQEGKLENVDAIVNRATSSSAADFKNKDEKLKEGIGQGRNQSPEEKIQIDEFFAVISWEDTTSGEAVWKSERFHFLIAGEDFLIKFDKCDLEPDRNPYILVRICTRPNQLVGNSVLMPLCDLEDQANNSMMRKRALVTQAADNPTFYNPASGFDPSKTRGRQGGFIAIVGQSVPQRLKVDAEPIAILNEDIQSMIGMMRESTPANEQFQGMAPSTDTATEANINYQTGGVRFGEIVDTISNDLFPALAREFMWQAKQYSQDGDLFVSESSIDGNVRVIKLSDLAGEWDFIASSMQTEGNRKQDVQGKMQLAEQLVEMQTKAPVLMIGQDGKPQQFAMLKFLLEEILPAAGIRTGKTYLQDAPPPPPPPPPEMPPPPSPPAPVLAAPGQEWYIPPAPGAPPAGPIMPPGQPMAPSGMGNPNPPMGMGPGMPPNGPMMSGSAPIPSLQAVDPNAIPPIKGAPAL
jgi:hypothetical protein